ncbi:hypothetical protein G647_06243 [Cladophialophora carrionii CBS 160.54]|uniref:Only prolin and serin are matching in the corresponding protein n=1 Tax=Cladophialophora carrionii CBS 160.54 TaxID=1279043 RepID=V9D5M2_9EURO|nr:uncharacterized protein G647_06243 [Cladophialophora carrionii CBS 160.54]ETI22170.1 hypothetical protein G647_06243 [Cladophialophora carrionii CBS 160.54]
MEHTAVYPSDAPTRSSHSAASSVSQSSPTQSLFSKGHSSRGSGSSIASSPVPRDSLDMFGAAKRLEDVTEEPHEKDEFDGYTLVNDGTCDWSYYDKALSNDYGHPSPTTTPADPVWSLGETDNWLLSPGRRQPKRRRSMEQPLTSHGNRLGGRFSSLSRRWKNRSAAGPQLSIVTHHSSPASRSGSLGSSQVRSPALSAISKHEGGLPSSPTLPYVNDCSFSAEAAPIDIVRRPEEDVAEPGQATTPLLPPLLSELGKKDEPIHSPLQSPAIAPTTALVTSLPSLDTPLSCLPSPPLSTRPSMVSMHSRSRTNTLTNSPFCDIPSMQLLEDASDPWDARLGHANFTIHPEPYVPDVFDLDSYTEYRKNWDQARTNYAKHIARTVEHYGSTSKVYKLTEEKWASIDNVWQRQHDLMRTAMAPVLARLSDGDSEMQDSTASSAVLEKPLTKLVVPLIDDKSGKFPELGDGEIVGPMSVARPRILTTDHDKNLGAKSPPLSPHKRNLIRFLSDIFHN